MTSSALCWPTPTAPLWIGTRRGLTHCPGGLPGARMEIFTQASGLGSDLVGAMARRWQGRPVGGHFCRALAVARRQDHQLHHCKWAFQQRRDGALTARQRTMLIGNTRPRLGISGTGRNSPWQYTTGRSKLQSTRFWKTAATIFGLPPANGIAELRQRYGGRLFALDRIRRCRRAAQPGDGHQQPSFGLALPATDTCGLPLPRDWLRWTRRASLSMRYRPPVALERFAVDDVDQALRWAASFVRIPLAMCTSSSTTPA